MDQISIAFVDKKTFNNPNMRFGLSIEVDINDILQSKKIERRDYLAKDDCLYLIIGGHGSAKLSHSPYVFTDKGMGFPFVNLITCLEPIISQYTYVFIDLSICYAMFANDSFDSLGYFVASTILNRAEFKVQQCFVFGMPEIVHAEKFAPWNSREYNFKHGEKSSLYIEQLDKLQEKMDSISQSSEQWRQIDQIYKKVDSSLDSEMAKLEDRTYLNGANYVYAYKDSSSFPVLIEGAFNRNVGQPKSFSRNRDVPRVLEWMRNVVNFNIKREHIPTVSEIRTQISKLVTY
ncbi:hypothetical protein [Cysteiniphilum sp. JM-1]|uniref:hypothetical protein n=1 Tax=Cysteiniphilum sp. JM-1 TaxID=2610891 RepID=UPI001247260A|nr:hypothetical protein [Cysteiniphilum sp. JM-1]